MSARLFAQTLCVLVLFLPPCKVSAETPDQESSAAIKASNDPFQIESIVVTGTRIRSKEGPAIAPVVIFTGEQLRQRGFTTLADFSRSLTINAGAVTEFTSVDGSASFNLRGLGSDATLMLLNGRRVAVRESAAGNSRLDINAIPISVVDRIEIQKDGASAIYGPDAVAGVVNIILKKDYLGTELDLQYRNTTDTDTSEYLLSASFGRLIGHGSVWGFLAHQDINALDAKDREFKSDRSDWLGPAGDLRTVLAFPGNYLVFDDDGTLDFSADPACANSSSIDDLPIREVFPRVDEFLTEHICRFDILAEYRVMKESRRSSVYVGFDFPRKKQQFFGEFFVNHRNTDHKFTPTLLLPTPIVGADHPNNTFGEPVVLLYTLADAGRRGTHNQWEFYQGIVGTRGPIGKWDYEVSITASKNEQERTFKNRILQDELTAALNGAGGPNGDSYYNPFGGGPNDPEVIAAITTDISDTTRGNSLVLEAFASRSIFEWRHGSSDLLVGLEYRERENRISSESPDRRVIDFFTLSESSYSRDVSSIFVEWTLPAYRDLDVQFAGRYENFSDFGSEISPKLAIRWQTNKYLVLRGSFSNAFKAPNFTELSGQSFSFFGSYQDPVRCPEPLSPLEDCSPGYFIPFNVQANPNLNPESGDSTVAGFVLSPSGFPDLALSLDYWRFDYQDRIQRLSSDAIATFFPNDPRFVIRSDPTPEDVAAGRPGPVVELTLPYINFEALETRGYDAAVTWKTEFRKLGVLELDFKTTYFQHFEFTDSLSTNPGNRVGTDSPVPLTRWRSNLTANWKLTDHSITANLNRVHSWIDEDVAFTVERRKVSALWTLDLLYQYTFPRLNFAQLSLGCIDCLNQGVPRGAFDLPLVLTGFYDPRGQQITVSYRQPF